MSRQVLCRTLFGARNLDFSLACLRSFIDNAADQIELEVFEDGTLSASDIIKVQSTLPNTTVIKRADREPAVFQKLDAYPKAKQFRSSNVLSLKFFDTMLYDDRDFLFLDSDIYFAKKFTLPAFNEFPIFMKDTENSYTFTPKRYWGISDRLLPLVNTGFMYFPLQKFSLDVIDNILAKYYTPRDMGHSWAEQTLWSYLGALSEKAYFFTPT